MTLEENEEFVQEKINEDNTKAEVIQPPSLEEIKERMKSPSVPLPKETISTPIIPQPSPAPASQGLQTEKLEIKGDVVHPILAQKLSGTFQNKVQETDHSLNNISKAPTPEAPKAPTSYPPKADPYRLSPDE